LQNNKEKNAQYKKQIDEIKSRNEAVRENLKENKKRKVILENEIETLEKEKEISIKNLDLKEKEIGKIRIGMDPKSFDEIDKIDEEINNLSEEKYNKEMIKQDNSIQIEKLNTKLEHLQDDLDRISVNARENKDQIDQLSKFRKELKSLIVAISKMSNLDAENSARLASLKKEYSDLNEELSSLQIKARAAETFISHNKAVETILKMKQSDSNIHGSIFELASSQSKYSMALESAAGKALYNIVVENDNTAVKYINFLKEKKIGSATFLPINKVNAKYRLDESVLNKKGAIDYALNLLKFDRKYEKIFNLVFADTLIIENIQDAKNIGIGSYKMVTLEGDLVGKSGAMSGGYKSKRSGIGVFKDDNNNEKIEKISRRIETIGSSISHLNDEKNNNERNLYESRQKKIELEAEVLKLEKLLSIEGRDTSSLEKEMEEILSDKQLIENSLKKITKDIEILDVKIYKIKEDRKNLKQSTQSSSLLKEVSILEEQRDKLKEENLNISSKIESRKIEIRSVLEPENINLSKILEDNEKSLNELNTISKSCLEEIKADEIELKELKVKEKNLSKDYKTHIEKRDKLKEYKEKFESKYEKEYLNFDKIKEKSSRLRFEIEEYEKLKNTLEDEMSNFI
jgi:chromosome segregation protein